jgi:cation diffusion facilitator CzcD-associated flavoprotein CzcO
MENEANPKHVRIAIVGSGFGGLGTAIRLKQAGIDDFLVFERANDVGGTWRDNSYPGCACDVPSHLYSFSFAPNPGWSRSFSPQPEIQRYLKGCAERFGILGHVKLEHEVIEAAYDESRAVWRIETSKGCFFADVLVAGAGPLSDAAIPSLEGMETFSGKSFHSARWDHAHDLSGRRVAVVGTGASAIQFIPEIQPKVEKLYVYQRTAPWIVPRRDRPLSRIAQRIYRAFPIAQKALRAAIYFLRELFVVAFMHPKLMRLSQGLALRYLERAIPDPVLRKKLTPSYTIGCKRILISDNYFPAIAQPNVEVITDRIERIGADAIVTSDGVARDVDTIIFGTGFQVSDPPIGKRVRGRGGRTLAEAWNGSPKAHLGTTVAGFPNFFMLLGPNTGLGHNSVVYMIECQIAHILGALRFLESSGARAVEPKAEAQDAFIADIDARLSGTVWNLGGCASWYIDKTGRNSTIWPGFTWSYKRRIARFDPAEYEIHGAPAAAATRPLELPASA